MSLAIIGYLISKQLIGYLIIIVPDRRRRIVPEAVVVRRWAVGVLGIWRGEGWVKGWDKGGNVSLQATWDRGGWILSQLGGFQVSRKGRQREICKGRQKQGECAMYSYNHRCAHVYMECLRRLNDTSSICIT
jgi:hypothetical protein